ncbi:MAG TPA: hypothetical protein VEY12_09690, partial [Thermoplasmata archaeon]|nr:hypothetical protein [Thermoplasmata archaeon]
MPPSPLPAPPRRRGFFVVILVSVTVPMVGSVAVGLVFFSGLYPGLSPCVVNFKPAVTLGAASSVGDGERIP